MKSLKNYAGCFIVLFVWKENEIHPADCSIIFLTSRKL